MHMLHNRFRVRNHSCVILSIMGPKSLWEDSWLRSERLNRPLLRMREEGRKSYSLDNSRVLSPR